MTTLTLIAAVLGALIPPVVIAQALRSKAKDRWPEGLLVGGLSRRARRRQPDREVSPRWAITSLKSARAAVRMP